ncbi:MAG: hypothetical protein ACLQGJ_11480 [Candidatus Dormibacteria bacterium]
MPSGGAPSTFFVTGAGDVLGDIGGFFTGPPGDPGRVRQIANLVDAVDSEYSRAALALDDAVLTLTQAWTGTATTAFRNAWTACTHDSPSSILSSLGDNLTLFARELRDYADRLEHAQNEHWVQLGVLAALTILNAAQGGADPATDAAEVAVGAGMEIGADLTLTGLGELALGGALTGFGSDVISQLGADLLDRLDPQFNETGDDVVPVFDPGEAAQSALQGALSSLDGGLGEGPGEMEGPLDDIEADPDPGLPGDLQDTEDLSAGDGTDEGLSPARVTGGSVEECARPFSAPELRIAEVLANEGDTVAAVCPTNDVRTYDAVVNGRPTEFKTVNGPKGGVATNVTVRSALSSANGQFGTITPGQMSNVVLDSRGSGLTEAEAERGLQRWLGTGRNRLDTIRIIGDGWGITWP